MKYISNEPGVPRQVTERKLHRLYLMSRQPFLLRKAEPSLQLKIFDDDPYIQFSGKDEKGRHIGAVGYGLFYSR